MSESKMTVNVTVDKNSVSVDLDTFTTGTVNNYEAVFDLPPEYDNLLLYALFNNTKCAIEESKCILPEFKKAGTLRVGVVAYDQYGDKLIERYSPRPAYVRVVEGSYIENEHAPDENISSDYEKLLSAADAANKAAEEATLAAEDAQQTADEIQEKADSGAFNGKDGDTGPQGDPGTAATIEIGTTTTGEPGTQASVTNTGTENAAVLNFTIPQGQSGILEYFKPLALSKTSPWQEVFELEDGVYIITADGKVQNTPSGETDARRVLRLDMSVGQILVKSGSYAEAFNDDGFAIFYPDNSHGDDVWAYNGEEITEMIQAALGTVSASTSVSLGLRNAYEYRYAEPITELNLSIASSDADNEKFTAALIFKSGTTAPTISYSSDDFKFTGDDCDFAGDFIPQPNTGYEISFKQLGYGYIVARVGAFPI